MATQPHNAQWARRPISVRCPAKLNLFLEVLRKRPDGYHDLDTVMQAVDLFDDLLIEPHEGPELSLVCSEPSLPTDGRNLVLRAALALRERTGHRGGAGLALTKRIPMQAGLGGGSSDAAGALAGLNRAWGLGLSTDELRQVAATLGSDVAFFLYGGTARCTGRGDIVEPLPAPAVFHYVLACPSVGVSTADAYARLSPLLTSPRASASMMAGMVTQGSVEGTGRCLFNRFEEAVFDARPELLDLKERLVHTPGVVGASLTGSGSAVFALCRPGEQGCVCALTADLAVAEVHAVRSAG